MEQLMSRSYKKNPVIKDCTRGMKKLANKRVRKHAVSNGNNYRKVFESWDIHDWKFKLWKLPKWLFGHNMSEEEIREFWGK